MVKNASGSTQRQRTNNRCSTNSNKRNAKQAFTRRADGRWQKKHKGKTYYFRTEAEAQEWWERLTPDDSETCPGDKGVRDGIIEIPLSEIIPAPENEQLYGPVLRSDPEVWNLSDSIEALGVLQPCIVTADKPHVTISGHKRTLAASVAGLETVPCKVIDVRWEDLTSDERLKLLREHNRYRHKSVAEQIRETMLDTDPEDAEQTLFRLRHESINRPERKGIEALEVEGKKVRHRISDVKSQHVEFIKKVVFEDREDYWPLSVRGIHYPLLNYQFMRNTRLKLRYFNDEKSYKATSDLCTRLRLLGEIPWTAIDDGTRPLTEFRAFHDARQFVRQEVDDLFGGYWRDLLQSQPNYIEAVVEKNTIYHMALRVTEKYQIPTMSGRGFSSIDPWHDLCLRYRASGKTRLILVVLSDYDPEGEMIPHVAGRTLRDDFGVEDLTIIKAGVTPKQIERYNLPPQNFAKESSSNHDWFVERNGGKDAVYELESLEPDNMLRDFEEVVTSTIDMDLYEAERERQREEAVYLSATRKVVRNALSEIDLSGEDDQ